MKSEMKSPLEKKKNQGRGQLAWDARRVNEKKGAGWNRKEYKKSNELGMILSNPAI